MKSHLALLAASALACARPVCAAAPLPPPADQALARDMLKSLMNIARAQAELSPGRADRLMRR